MLIDKVFQTPTVSLIFGRLCCKCLNQSHGVFGNHQFLIGRDDAYRHFAVRCGDDGFIATYGIVFGFVERYAQIVQTIAESLAHVGLVFSHASGEEDDVHPVHGRSVSTDIFFSRGRRTCREPSGSVGCLRGLRQSPHACPEETPVTPATPDFFVQEVGHFRRSKPFLVHDKGYRAAVYIAGTGTHHQAFQRSQSHGGVDTFAVFTAEMEPPLPTWQVMMRLPAGSTPRYSQTRWDT